MDPVTLCNLALDQISSTRQGNAVTSLSPPSPPNSLNAQVAARTYQPQVDATFRAAHWNSARRQVALTLLSSAVGTPENPTGKDALGNTLPVPPMPWLYEYAWPPDCLAMRFVMPQPSPLVTGSPPLMTNLGVSSFPQVVTSVPFVPAIDLDSSGNQIKVILTNARTAQGVYTGRINNVDLWDSSLQNAVIAVLASWFALPCTGKMDLMKLRTQIAVGLIQQARITDGNEGITTTDHTPDFMQVRNAGTIWGSGFLGDTPYIMNWSTIGMADGLSY